jgi:hypothetical protein
MMATCENFDVKPRTEHPNPNEIVNCPGCAVSIEADKTNQAILTAAGRYTIHCYLCPDCDFVVSAGTESERMALAEEINQLVVTLGWFPEGKYV